MMLGVRDLDRIQAAFPDLQTELVGGKVVVMSPSDAVSSAVAAQFAALLLPYVRERKLGRVFGADGGFILPNGDLRAPDVSFVSYRRLRALPQRYADVAPDLAVEVRSSTDRPRDILKKLEAYLDAGTLAAVYVDPSRHEVRILRNDREEQRFGDDDLISVPELFPEWEIAVRELWPPEAP